jgi:pyrroloquinoline quinone biosynthesis protein B
MRVRLLGTAAGGGLPQWNCRCANCQAAREGLIAPLTSCSLAFSPDGGEWYLINATSDVTQQLARWAELSPPSGLRSTPLRGVFLTDGELDHVLGLLHLREGMPWTLHATASVAAMLEDNLRLLPTLRRYADVSTRALPLGEPLAIGAGSSKVEVRVVETGRRPPRYQAQIQHEMSGAVVAVILTDLSTGKRAVYAPGVGRLSHALFDYCGGADVLFFDGTFWTDDELRVFGISEDTSTDMGHVPVSGPDGSALWLSRLSTPVKLYVHLNNTNPLLDAASGERAWIRRLGLDVASDGWEATL